VTPPDPVAPPPPPPPPPPQGRVVTNIPAGPGLSEAEMATYAKLCEDNKGKNGHINYNLISASERSQLNELFRRMSEKQRSNQTVLFRKVNHYEQTPTQNQVDEWKNAKKYGLWIDGRKVNNHELNRYDAADFKHYSVSKLHKNTVNYGKYYFQVDLQTAEYFKKIKAQADTSEVIVFRMPALPKR
jgi:bla regulator protein blaR1